MARLDDEIDKIQYRDYVTKSLQLIPQDRHLVKSYAEITGRVKVDERTGDEIAEDVITGAGLIMG